MAEIHYEIVKHNGGWAYKLADVFSETFPSHDAALKAAKDVAARQELAGETTGILYEDADGQWHEEVASGDDRPHADVLDCTEK